MTSVPREASTPQRRASGGMPVLVTAAQSAKMGRLKRRDLNLVRALTDLWTLGSGAWLIK